MTTSTAPALSNTQNGWSVTNAALVGVVLAVALMLGGFFSSCGAGFFFFQPLPQAINRGVISLRDFL